MGTTIAWIWFLYQLLPRQVYPGWDTLSYVAVGNRPFDVTSMFVLRPLHCVSLQDVWSQQQNPEHSRWVEREDWCHGFWMEVVGSTGWRGQLQLLALDVNKVVGLRYWKTGKKLWGWHPSTEICRSVTLVMNCVLLGAFGGWCIVIIRICSFLSV